MAKPEQMETILATKARYRKYPPTQNCFRIRSHNYPVPDHTSHAHSMLRQKDPNSYTFPSAHAGLPPVATSTHPFRFYNANLPFHRHLMCGCCSSVPVSESSQRRRRSSEDDSGNVEGGALRGEACQPPPFAPPPPCGLPQFFPSDPRPPPFVPMDDSRNVEGGALRGETYRPPATPTPPPFLPRVAGSDSEASAGDDSALPMRPGTESGHVASEERHFW